jgi:uncharacterized protein HemX
MAAETKRGDALQLIFSLFVGVLTAVVVGVGVWTFYPPPQGENQPKQQELQRLQEEQGMKFDKSRDQMTPQERRDFDKREKRIQELNRQIQKQFKSWAVVTSIVVITIATVLMAISLFLPETAKVFSNGILLGGLFTVLYGTGVSFTGGNNWARFFVVLAALLLSLGIGYLRFVRGRKAVAAAAEGAAAPSTEIEARVAVLESKLAAIQSAFGGHD